MPGGKEFVMDLFQMKKKPDREGAAPRQTGLARAYTWRFRRAYKWRPYTLLLFLVIGMTCVSVARQAHASSVGTSAIQLSSLTMFDQQHGWALNDATRHVFTTQQGPEHWSDVTPPQLANSDVITSNLFQDTTHAYIGVLQGPDTLLLSTQDGGHTWKRTAFTIPGASPGDVSISQIAFLDLSHGWLTFIRGQIAPGIFDFVLMSTANGGKTWQTVLDTSINTHGLERPYGGSLHFTFDSPTKGWAIGGQPTAGVVYLYTTSDGGKTWSQANIAPIKGGDNIDFTQDYGPYWQNSQQGTLYVNYDNAGANLVVYRTQDGGKSWLLGPSTPATSLQEFNTLSFLNARAACSFGFDGTGNYIMHQTSDGGLTWKKFQPTGLIPADADNMVLLDLDFINSTTGWLTLKDAQDNVHLFQTTNGGHTWSALNPVA